MLFIFLFVFTNIYSTLAAAARGGLLLVAIRRLHLRIRQKLFNSIIHQEIDFFDTNQTGIFLAISIFNY